jgi:hypothetical protein
MSNAAEAPKVSRRERKKLQRVIDSPNPLVQLVAPAIVKAYGDKVDKLAKPDESREDHPTSTSKVCGATAWSAGRLVVCTQVALHGGRHSAEGRTWRPRSGDAQ